MCGFIVIETRKCVFSVLRDWLSVTTHTFERQWNVPGGLPEENELKRKIQVASALIFSTPKTRRT